MSKLHFESHRINHQPFLATIDKTATLVPNSRVWDQGIGFIKWGKDPAKTPCCIGARLAYWWQLLSFSKQNNLIYFFGNGARELALRSRLSENDLDFLLYMCGAPYEPFGSCPWLTPVLTVWRRVMQWESLPSSKAKAIKSHLTDKRDEFGPYAMEDPEFLELARPFLIPSCQTPPRSTPQSLTPLTPGAVTGNAKAAGNTRPLVASRCSSLITPPPTSPESDA